MNASANSADKSDVAELFVRLKSCPAESPERELIRERLVHEHLDLARNLARKFRNSDEAFEDLVQVANVGLLNAIDRFDPHYGNDFLAFAVPTISGELRRHFRDTSWSVRVPRRLKELHIVIASAREELTTRLSRAPKPSEIAEHLGISREEVHEGLVAGQGRYGNSLDSMLEDTADRKFGTADDNLDQAELRELLRPVVGTLPERERKIVLLRFGLGLSQADIARRVGISQMQVSRLLTKTLTKLRTEIGDLGNQI